MKKQAYNFSGDIASRSGKRRLFPDVDIHARRGSLYIAVVSVGALISVLGMSALLIGRINLRAHTGLSDCTIARLNAQTALRLGMLEIESSSDWRFEHDTDEWFVDRPLSDGTYSLEVRDTSDDDVSDAAADPVVLTGIGKKGDAVHRTQITLSPLYRGYDCLQSAVHAGDDVNIWDSYYFSVDHLISANDDVTASSAYVGCPVEASDSVSGYYFYGTRESGVPQRTIPATEDVLDFYRRNGTWINLSNIPQGFANMIRNGSAESNTDFWAEETSTVTADSNTANSGTQSLLIAGRNDDTSGVAQDVTHLLQSGRACEIELAIYPTQVGQQFYVHLEMDDANGNDDHVAGPFTGAVDTWTTVSTTLTPWFEEPLSIARLVINSAAYASYYAGYYGSGSAPADFRVDDVELRESGSTRAMDQILLSPGSNPFGDTNDRGIYVIDLQGQKLIIKKSRIHGTLVLINPGNSTELGDNAPLAMSPAVPSYPTLLVDGGKFYINPSDGGLVESAMQVNLNPVDAPYGSVGSDSDLDDTFASKIEGLIFSDETIRLQNVKIDGAVISHKDVKIQDGFTMTFDNRFYRNPPPGFSGPEQIRLLLGSAKRTTE